MLKKLGCTLALSLSAALPLHAVSAPVTVSTHTSGTSLFGDFVILGALGMTDFDYTSLPYDMTLRSSFDTDVNFSVWLGNNLVISDVDLSVTFRLGSETFQQQGKGTVTLSSLPGSYTQQVSFAEGTDTKYVAFFNGVYTDQGTAGSDPLAARELSAAGNGAGAMGIDAMPWNPESPAFWTMGAAAHNGSILVSAVPEPSQWGMMAAGLLAVSAVARRRQA